VGVGEDVIITGRPHFQLLLTTVIFPLEGLIMIRPSQFDLNSEFHSRELGSSSKVGMCETRPFLVLVPLICNADLEENKPKFIHSFSKIILQYSFFLFSRRLALSGSFFLNYVLIYMMYQLKVSETYKILLFT